MERDFRVKNSFEMVSSLLKTVWEAGFNVRMWQIIGKEQCEVNLKFVVVNGPKKEIILEFNPDDLPELNKMLAPKVDANFFIAEEMMLFRANIKNVIPHENRIKITFPSNVSMTERRVGPRHLTINKADNFQIKFKLTDRKSDGKIFKKNCYDLSREGMSFIINNTESKYFKTGDQIELADLEKSGESFPISLKVLSIIPIEPSDINGLLYSSVKIGTKFSQNSSVAEKMINRIMDELDQKRAENR